MTGLVVSGPRPIPNKKKGMTEQLVIVKTPNRIVEHRFIDPAEAEAFAKAAKGEG
jgi:hypothetical protein